MDFRIHGDNIVECERTLSVVLEAFDCEVQAVEGPLESVVCPRFKVHLTDKKSALTFQFFPGYGRWKEDILGLIRDKGGVLREAADAIITRVTGKTEEPILAIEYCGALPAGNQAWQRNGRAYSFAMAKVPFAYIAELGGYELDSARHRRAMRLPNPAVPFSYLTLSRSTDVPLLQIVVPSPGAHDTLQGHYQPIFGWKVFITMIKKMILGENCDSEVTTLEHNGLEFVKLLAANRSRNDSLTADQWEAAYTHVAEGQSLTSFLLKEARQPWSKTAYIAALTPSARSLMDLAAKCAIGLTSTNLPMCIIPPDKNDKFVVGLAGVYGDLSREFTDWLRGEDALTICWIMGFKPGGDDARPDRGLAPLARMLIGAKGKLLTVIYGPAPAETWNQLESSPGALGQANGLWEAIMGVSDCLLVDSGTAGGLRTRTFLKKHWMSDVKAKTQASLLVTPAPTRVGEHDVDTVLHLFLARMGAPNVHEGMCNPPGGDWSGMSLWTPDQEAELRWLSLPRVTAVAKRPDHLFQMFVKGKRPIILAIESKDRGQQIEENIGPRLIQYVTDLAQTVPSIQRSITTKAWVHASQRADLTKADMASAAAFVSSGGNDLKVIAAKSKADLILGASFEDAGRICNVIAYGSTDLGKTVIKMLQELQNPKIGIAIRPVT